MTEERRANDLARWLAEPPGTLPPPGVDADVVEAIYSLRPDLAPPPSVSIDDILAGVTTGPLATAEVPDEVAGGEVVAFRGLPQREPEPVNAPTSAPWWRAANRWGGVGVMVATAATLILVAFPLLTSPQAERAPSEAAPAMAAPAPPPAAAEDAAAPSLEKAKTVEPVEQAQAAAPPAARATPAGEPLAGATGRLQEAARPGDAEDALPIGRSNGTTSSQLIPEVASAADDADEGAAGSVDGPASPPGDGQGRPGAYAPDGGWRASVDPATLTRLDRTNAVAQSEAAGGNPRAAADMLTETIAPPAPAGQHQAALAARYYLAAGLSAEAMNAARRGLALSDENTAERSALLVVLGDAMVALGDPSGAEHMYREASELDATR